MKNKLFLAALASLTLAACSNDDVVSTQTSSNADQINFRSSVTNSRATDVTTANLNEFWVAAFMRDTKAQEWSGNGIKKFIKSGDEFVVNGSNGVTWPTYDLDFYAANIDASDSNYPFTAPTSSTPAKYGFKTKETIAEQKDFVYATNSGARDDYKDATTGDFKSIPLDFKHALSKIKIQAKCSYSNITVRVKGYRITNVYGNGTFSFGDVEKSTTVGKTNVGSWSDLSNISTFKSAFINGETVTANSLSDTDEGNNILLTSTEYTEITTPDGWPMFIPQTGTAYNKTIVGNTSTKGVSIDLLVQIDYAAATVGGVGAPLFPAYDKADGTKRIWYENLPKYYGYVSIPAAINWEPGKCYTYNIEFVSGAGMVDPNLPEPGDPNADDPFNGEDEVIGHDIKFSVTVSNFDDGTSSETYPLDLTW